jgi:UDP-N-acetylglucosamine acyltransferase
MVTSIGDDNLLMAYSHIAHDVRIGNHAVIANGVTFAGHVSVGDWAVIGAFTGIHQFCRIGRHSMIGGYSVVTQDILPFATTVSEREIHVFGENRIGLERRGFSAECIEVIHKALRLLTRSNLNTSQALARIREEIPPSPEVDELIQFIDTSERGFVK